MADEIRRVRTQAERDADGTTWRATAASRPGYATYPQTTPGSPSWWARHGQQPPARPEPTRVEPAPARDVMDALAEVLAVDADHFMQPRDPNAPPLHWRDITGVEPEPERVEEMRAALVESAATGQPVMLPDGSASIAYRRRWWHRYTRRNP